MHSEDNFDFIVLERRRAVAEACSSLGLVGQRLIIFAEAETPPGNTPDETALELALRITARLIMVITQPEPAAEVKSYLWDNTARCNAAMALVKLCSDPRISSPTLPSFNGTRGPDRFLYGAWRIRSPFCKSLAIVPCMATS